TPSGGEENTPSGGEENTPSGGEEHTPSGGEENTPSGGEENTPSGDEENTPSGGEGNKPSGGEESKPSGGEENTPTVPEKSLGLLSVTSPIKRGNKATVEVRGKPGVEYDIVVRYSSGESSAAGLENKTADAEGYVSWTWRVGGSTKAGTYTVRVIGGGEELEITLTVTA
ncbi:MAG: hypothetical protein IJX62_06960, partial [Clostridia bacterium]|nr:hypothetical protein [Clostridia bacterium]